MLDHKTIYLAPLCFGEERFWCQDDAPVDCDCMDGPHSWARYERATTKSSEGELLNEALAALQFYADKSAWNEPPVKTVEGLISVEYENQASKVRRDRGAIARAFLAKAGKAQS